MKHLMIFLLSALALFLPAMAFAQEDFQVHGFVSQGYLASDHNNFLGNSAKGSFEFRETGINFSTTPTDKLHIAAQLLARDLGDVGNDEVTLDWGYASYRWQDYLGLRAGKMKIPFGLYNETRDIDMLRTSILLPQSLYSEAWRDTFSAINGVGVFGFLPGGFSYQLQAGFLPFDTNGGVAKTVEGISGLELTSHGDVDKSYVAALTWEPPVDGLRLRGSLLRTGLQIDAVAHSAALQALLGATPLFYQLDRKSYALSAEYTLGNLLLAAEYTRLDTAVKLNIKGSNAPSLRDETIHSEGYYGSASYRFTDWLELGAYYSVYYFDRGDKYGRKRVLAGFGTLGEFAYQKDLAVSSRFDVNEHWVIKLEAHDMEGLGSGFINDNIQSDDTLKVKKDWYLLAAKLTFSF